MEIENLLSGSIAWLKTEPVIAAVVIIIVVLLFLFKTKPMLKICGILFLFAFLIYAITMITNFTSTGVAQKEKMVEQEIE